MKLDPGNSLLVGPARHRSFTEAQTAAGTLGGCSRCHRGRSEESKEINTLQYTTNNKCPPSISKSLLPLPPPAMAISAGYKAALVSGNYPFLKVVEKLSGNQ